MIVKHIWEYVFFLQNFTTARNMLKCFIEISHRLFGTIKCHYFVKSCTLTSTYLWACNTPDGCRWPLSPSPGDTVWPPWWRAPTSSPGVRPAPLWHLWCVWSAGRLLESVCTSHPWGRKNRDRVGLQEQAGKLSGRNIKMFKQYSAHGVWVRKTWLSFTYKMLSLHCNKQSKGVF